MHSQGELLTPCHSRIGCHVTRHDFEGSPDLLYSITFLQYALCINLFNKKARLTDRVFWLGHAVARVRWGDHILMRNTTTTLPKLQNYSPERYVKLTTRREVCLLHQHDYLLMFCDREKWLRYEPVIEYWVVNIILQA